MNIYALNTLGFGFDTCHILAGSLPLQGIICLSDRQANDSISGFMPGESFCSEHDLEFIAVEDYSLKSKADRDLIAKLSIDILLITGWQRLIPQWLIDHCRISVVGIHGSPGGIASGRGRSPQTWSLILGKDKFTLSIFKITPGIDAGPVYDTDTFTLSANDDIAVSYAKSSRLAAEMIIRSFDRIIADRAIPQTGPFYYFPQRQPSDGAIDWTRGSVEIHNFVRAQTRPYPGAFTYLDKTKLKIWRTGLIDNYTIEEEVSPGQILEVSNSELLVGTGNGVIKVTEYESEGTALSPDSIDGQFKSVDFTEQMNSIIERHKEKYPDLPLSPDILSLIENEKTIECGGGR